MNRAENIDGQMRIVEMRANDRNAFVNTMSNKISGSYVTMRVPGSPHKLMMFEYNSFASSNNKEFEEEGEGGWMKSLIKPLFMVALIGGTCWISYSSTKSRGDRKSSKGFLGSKKSDPFPS